MLAGCRSNPVPARVTEPKAAPAWMVQAAAQGRDGGADAVPVEDVAGANAFALRLLRQAAKTQPDVALSPWSVRAVLGLVGVGAAGDTWEELRTVAGFDASQAVTAQRLGEGTAALGKLDAMSGLSANGLFVGHHTKPLPSYLALATTGLGATVESLDFADASAARDHINAWGDRNTGHRVPEVLPADAINDRTRLVATNALAMSAQWQAPFPVDLTAGRPFHGPGGRVTVVPMMSREGRWTWRHDEDFDVVLLPYRGERLELVLVVPTAQDGLESVEARLERQGLEAAVKGVAPEQLSLYLPAFTQEATWELKDALVALGLPTVFSPKADLSGINGAQDLYLAAVHHRVVIDLDETGTRAAAVTAAMLQTKGMLARVPAVLVVDHPFLYFVRERPSGAILFEGRVVNPKSKHAPVPAAESPGDDGPLARHRGEHRVLTSAGHPPAPMNAPSSRSAPHERHEHEPPPVGPPRRRAEHRLLGRREDRGRRWPARAAQP